MQCMHELHGWLPPSTHLDLVDRGCIAASSVWCASPADAIASFWVVEGHLVLQQPQWFLLVDVHLSFSGWKSTDLGASVQQHCSSAGGSLWHWIGITTVYMYQELDELLGQLWMLQTLRSQLKYYHLSTYIPSTWLLVRVSMSRSKTFHSLGGKLPLGAM